MDRAEGGRCVGFLGYPAEGKVRTHWTIKPAYDYINRQYNRYMQDERFSPYKHGCVGFVGMGRVEGEVRAEVHPHVAAVGL